MNKDQGAAILERLATVFVTWFLTWASQKGYITTSQAAEFLPLLVGVVAPLYAWWVTRPVSILQAAANIPEVNKVEMKPTLEGKSLAESVPSNKVDT